MSAYVISMMTINDPETYRNYTDRTPPTVKKYGGKFLTRGEPVATFEGDTVLEADYMELKDIWQQPLNLDKDAS